MKMESVLSVVFVIYLVAALTLLARASDWNSEKTGIINDSKSKSGHLRLQRLQTTADIWSKLYIIHPLAFSNNVDFDNILLTVLPAVEKANTTEEFVAALNRTLFGLLGDPLAFAQIINKQNEKNNEEEKPANLNRISDAVVILNATDLRSFDSGNIINQINNLLKTVKKQDTLIVDLRCKDEKLYSYRIGVVLRLFANKSLPSGFRVSRQHLRWSDFTPNAESSVWGNNKQTFKIEPTKNLEPVKESKNEPGW